jgi:hypothetical protein
VKPAIVGGLDPLLARVERRGVSPDVLTLGAVGGLLAAGGVAVAAVLLHGARARPAPET